MIQYYYKKLSLQEQILYKKMHEALKRQNEFILCGANECLEETYYNVLDAILLDNPSVFYVMPHGLHFEHTMLGLTKIIIEYIDNRTIREEFQLKLLTNINQLYEQKALSDCSEEEKAQRLYSLLAFEVKIVDMSEKIQPFENTMIGALIWKKSTAEGIPFCYKFLLDQMGIENIIVRGFVSKDGQESQKHMWNVLKIGNEERHVDIVEDIIQNGSNGPDQKYFARSPEEIGIDHFWEGKRIETKEQDNWSGYKSYVEPDTGRWEILDCKILKGIAVNLDEKQEKLLCALAKYPLECSDSRRLKAVLCDVLQTDDKAITNVFLSAYEENIHVKLGENEDIHLIETTMKSTLERKYGYNPKLCDWAVQTWVLLNALRSKV